MGQCKWLKIGPLDINDPFLGTYQPFKFNKINKFYTWYIQTFYIFSLRKHFVQENRFCMITSNIHFDDKVGISKYFFKTYNTD